MNKHRYLSAPLDLLDREEIPFAFTQSESVPFFSIYLEPFFLPGFENLEQKSSFCIACSFKIIPSQGFSALEETPWESLLSGFNLILILERLNVTVVTKIFGWFRKF